MRRPPKSTLFPTRRSSDLAIRRVLPVVLQAGVSGLAGLELAAQERVVLRGDRKSTRLNSSHVEISYAVFCLKKKNTTLIMIRHNTDVMALSTTPTLTLITS